MASASILAAPDNNPAGEVKTQGSISEAPISSSYCVPYRSHLTIGSQETSEGEKYTVEDDGGQILFNAMILTKSLKASTCVTTGYVANTSGVKFAHLKYGLASRFGVDGWDVYRNHLPTESSFLFTVWKTGLVSTSFAIRLSRNPSAKPDFKIVSKGFFAMTKFLILRRRLPIGEVRVKGYKAELKVNPNEDRAFISTVMIIVIQMAKLFMMRRERENAATDRPEMDISFILSG